ncbi:hypothetical protein [Aliiruegeria lutimaris]|uniref:Uncharacterized protein n=1 Tax=Aliiruegeria lutimaris TaxID=571298 RepID=A0A1G8IQ22_9RHOB|nr:hypothetical protein [Aliiruegeria lutimaris]SDI21138.1 hypothetical protein SAMN04488026_1001100 [Aliiruegeria lutimaris]
MILKYARLILRKRIGRLATLVFAACIAGGAAIASEGELGEGSYGGERKGEAASQGTALILLKLKEGKERCALIPWIYRYDCLAQGFTEASQAKVRYRELEPAQEILAMAGQKMAAVVERHLDPAQPPSRIGNRTYKAVKQSARAEANAEAQAVLDETESLLLRSYGPPKMAAHYERIAMAVSSSDVLLRSALEPLPGRRNPAIEAIRRFAGLALSFGRVYG